MRTAREYSLMLIVLFVLILAFIGMIALARIIYPEIYVIAIIVLSLLTCLSLIKRRFYVFLYVILVVYLIICSSWTLASRFQTLPRDDVYHYYPFTKYIYETGHFTQINEEKSLEEIFLGTIVPWPAWHILLAVFSHITNISLFYIMQISPLLITSPLVILSSILLAKTMVTYIAHKSVLRSPYVLPILVGFLSFYVYSNTTVVSRSLASTMYILLLYVFAKINLKRSSAYYLVLSLLLLNTIFVHPYWGLAAPLLMLITALTMLTFIRLKKIPLKLCSQSLWTFSLSTLGLYFIWVLYYSYTAQISLASAINRLFKISEVSYVSRVLGTEVARPWLETYTAQTIFFKTHTAEHVIYWMLWATDIIPLALAVPGFIMLLIKITRRHLLNMEHIIVLSLLVAASIVTLLTGAASEGLVTRYAVKIVYVPLCLLAIMVLAYYESVTRRKKIYMLFLTFLTMFYILTAALSLGTRTYQASFIWSSSVSFEDKGMHCTFAKHVMMFANRYCNYMTYNDILADDTVIRIFLDTKTFIELSEKTGKMPPHSFMRLSQLNTNVANILIISVRKFKPTYWMLRKWTWHRVNILENARIAKYIVLSEGLRLYDSNLAQIYYLV